MHVFIDVHAFFVSGVDKYPIGVYNQNTHQGYMKE